MDATNQSLATLQALRGVSVTYRRGAVGVPVVAIPAKTIVEGADEANTITITRMRDWLIEADDLADGGELLTPEAGDEIEHATAARTVTYQVTMPAINMPVYREIGDLGEWLRVHSQKIA